MRRSILILAAFLLAVAPGFAQSIWYVDPVNGDDLNSGAASAPWKTLTHALTVAGSGDQVELSEGAYIAANENYPIGLVDGVQIYYPGTDHAAVFNVGGTTSGFRVNSVFTDGATLRGITISQSTIGVEVVSGGGSTGAVVDVVDCLFQSYTVAGVRAYLDVAGNHRIWVRDCAFTPSSAPHGVRIRVRGASAVLELSVVQDNTITNCETGVAIEASDGGEVVSTSAVSGNDISGATTACIELSAAATAARDATNSIGVHSNRLSSGTIGLLVSTDSVSGQDALCDSAVDYNWISGNTTNIELNTTNNNFSGADLTCSFTGNLIVNATGDGVVCKVGAPQTGGVNCLPDFGTTSLGTGRNTFKGNSGFNLVLDLDMVNYLTLLNLLQVENNFWSLGTLFEVQAKIDYRGVSQTTVDLDPILLDALSVTLKPNQVPENTIRMITVTAKNVNTAFVDNDDATATINQMICAVRKGATTITVTPNVFADGSGFTFNTPALAEEGTWRLDIALPGGQGVSATFRVSTVGGGSGSSTGCFVATAAHGDEDAREVRVLRRFRDDYLLASAPGRSFVRSYYEHGPAAAEWIDEREWARQGARAALAAPVIAAEGLLRSRPAERFGLAVLVLGAVFWLLRRR